MNTAILLGCVAQKRKHCAHAKDLYCSPLWERRRAYAEASGLPWMILSALHGLVDRDDFLCPYDLALASLPVAERRAWGERVVKALDEQFGSLDGFVFEVHAGAAYVKAIQPPLEHRGARLEVPLARLGLGKQLAWYAATCPSGRRRNCTPEEIEAALAVLDEGSARIRAVSWPRTLEDLDQAGLYSWWVDQDGAQDLTRGLGVTVRPGRIYAGLTGATKWPSGKVGKMTLRDRIGSNHLRGTIEGSTFRRALAACLRKPLHLKLDGQGRLTRESEERLSSWMLEHLDVAVYPYEHRDALANLEHEVLAALDPPLNLEGMPTTKIRTSLTLLRSRLSADLRQDKTLKGGGNEVLGP